MTDQTPGTDMVAAPKAPAAVAPIDPQQAVAALKQRNEVMQTVMREVMRQDVDYGQIPGTQGLTLLKPGAEKLGVVFALAPRYEVTDLSAGGEITYRVTCELYSRDTGLFIGSGMGECTSLEERYAWRKAAKAEYDSTEASRRREKHYGSGKALQVRQDPANVRHTVMSQASKRALVAATRAATGASDLFVDGADAPVVKIGKHAYHTLLGLMSTKGMGEGEVKDRLAKRGFDGEIKDMPYQLWEQFCAWLAKRDDAEPEEADDEPVETGAEEVDPLDEALGTTPPEDDEGDASQQSLEG